MKFFSALGDIGVHSRSACGHYAVVRPPAGGFRAVAFSALWCRGVTIGDAPDADAAQQLCRDHHADAMAAWRAGRAA